MIARICVVVVACGALAGCDLIGAAAQPTAARYQWTGAPLNPPLTKPAFTLTDDHGGSLDLQTTTAGKVTLLYFGYTNCPNLCPENMAMLAFALKDVPTNIRAKIVVVFVTTDPARDTPSVLSTWLDKFNPSFIGLTGTKAQVDVAQAVAQVPLAPRYPRPLEPDTWSITRRRSSSTRPTTSRTSSSLKACRRVESHVISTAWSRMAGRATDCSNGEHRGAPAA